MRFNLKHGLTFLAMIFAMVNLSAQNLTVAETVSGSTANGWIEWATSTIYDNNMTGTTTIDGVQYTVTASWSGGSRQSFGNVQQYLDLGSQYPDVVTAANNVQQNLVPSNLTDKKKHITYLHNDANASTGTVITFSVSPAAKLARLNVGDAESDVAKNNAYFYWHDSYNISGANFTEWNKGGYNSTATPTVAPNSFSIPTTYIDQNNYAEEYVYHGLGQSTSSFSVSVPGGSHQTTNGLKHAQFSMLFMSLQLMEPCNAGTSAPTLNSNDFFNASTSVYTIPCGSSTAHLTNISASNEPSGTSLTWHTSSTASSSNLVSNPQSAPTGVYYAAFYDSTNSCYSTATTQVTVVAETDCCNAGNVAPSVN